MTWLLFEAIRIDYKGAGIFSTAFSCWMLFEVKNYRGFWFAYSDLLIAWNAIFVLLIYISLRALYRNTMRDAGKLKNQEITAILWVLLALIIILTINVVIVSSRVTGVPFQ